MDLVNGQVQSTRRTKQIIDLILSKLKIHNFHLTGEKGTYQISFSIDEDNIESQCTCNYQSDKTYCWHRYYILAGKTPRVSPDELEQQQQLIHDLHRSSGGRDLVRHAKATFGEKETCRRCNKSEVMDLRKGVLGRAVSVFVPSGRRYFCWSCRWSW